MKLLTLHRKIASVNYKHSLCSLAAFFVFSTTIFTILVPFYITSALYKDLWTQPKIVFEQPDIQFKHNYIVSTEYSSVTNENEKQFSTFQSSVCSSYKFLNGILDNSIDCPMIKVSINHVNSEQSTIFCLNFNFLSLFMIFSFGKRISIMIRKVIYLHLK